MKNQNHSSHGTHFVNSSYLSAFRLNSSKKEVQYMDKHQKEDICAAKEIAQNLIETANVNEEGCESDTCFLIYGVLRDCGYQIKKIIGKKQFNLIEC